MIIAIKRECNWYLFWIDATWCLCHWNNKTMVIDEGNRYSIVILLLCRLIALRNRMTFWKITLTRLNMKETFFFLSLSLSGPKWNGWRSLPARRCSFHVKGYAFVTTRKPPSLRIPAASFNFLIIKFNPNWHYSIQRKKYYFLRVTSKFWVRNCGRKFELKQRRCKSRLSSNPFGGIFIFQITSDLILRYLIRCGTFNLGVFQKKNFTSKT